MLYSFTGGLDGGQPYAGVIFDPAGNLYGVTEWGGVSNCGTVFQLTPSPGGWTENVLYNFTGGPDGFDPVGGLDFDEAGNLYGTTSGGGAGNACGTVFKLSPSDSGWNYTLLHTFIADGNDGCYPISNVRASTTYVWGTTLAGGPSDQGTVFTVAISGGAYGVGAFKQNKGNEPFGNINSWRYGTTMFGGRYGEGNVYELVGGREGFLSKHSFSPLDKAGRYPVGDLLPLLVGGVRTMYGTTNKTAYQLTEKHFDVWSISVMHSFSGSDGLSPNAGLTADAAGNLYGTTEWGGTDPGYDGTVFKLTPAGKNWTHALLYAFSGGTDGGNVTSGVVLDNAGNLYGTTSLGGTYNKGVVYEVTPPATTTTTLTSSPNPSKHYQAVTFTAVVTSSAGAPPDGETVSFMKGKTVLGTGSLSGGSASFTTSRLPLGTSSITAAYGGDSDFFGSTSNVLKQVVE